MLIYFLVVITVVTWTTIYFLYFRARILGWFDNRFGRDSEPKVDAAPPEEPQMSFHYSSSSEEELH